MADVSQQIEELEADIRMLESQPNSATDPELLDAIAWRQDQLAQLRGDVGGGGGGGDGAFDGADGDGDVALSEDDIRAMFDYYANFGRSTAQGTMDTMDSFMFMKFAKECPGLLGGALTRTEVDLIFTKAKPKGERRLEFEHFLDALSAFSEKKYPGIDPADALQSLITKHLVPQYEMVQLEMAKTGETEIPVTGVFKRLYDVRNYTGVYAERFRSGDGRINSHADNRVGRQYRGNTNTGTDEVIHNIASVMRPNLRSTGSTMPKSRSKKKLTTPRRRTPKGKSPGTPRDGLRRTMSSVTDLRRTPGSASSGLRRTATSVSDMRGSSRSLLSSPTASPRGYGGAASPASSAGGGANASAIMAGNEDSLVRALAAARGGDTEPLCRLAVELAAEARRVAADNEFLKRQLATARSGAAKNGGAGGAVASPKQPSRAAPPPPPPGGRGGSSSGGGGTPARREANGGGGAQLDALKREVDGLMDKLNSLPDDSPSARGVLDQLRDAERRYEAALSASINLPKSGAGVAPPHTPGSASGRNLHRGQSSASMLLPPEAPPVPETLQEEHLQDIFSWYANFGRTAAQSRAETMDSFMFMKFAKECPGLLQGGVTRTEVDLIFTKAKPKGERRLEFRCFLDALSALSEKRYPDREPADGLRHLLTDHLAPLWSFVQLERAKTGETEIPVSGVFQRLYDVRNYTGVYAERFRSGDGRINSHADNRVGRSFHGNTNTGTDEVIHNIASIMRPNLRATGSTMPKKRGTDSPRRTASSSRLA